MMAASSSSLGYFAASAGDSPPRRVDDTEGAGGDSSLVDVSMTHLDGSTDAERRKKLSIVRLLKMSMQVWPSSEELSLYCGEPPPFDGRNPTNKARQLSRDLKKRYS
jgi:hypothetical protein